MQYKDFRLDTTQSWLGSPAKRLGEYNIGTDGENLTLVFLSMNRSLLSIKLLSSWIKYIPHYAGNILIVDNGSDPSELNTLRTFLETKCPFKYEILELGRNFGVSGGRNRGFRAVKTDWIMSLDNDIYLTGNPLPQIKRDLSYLGAHFLSVPLINPDMKTLYSFGADIDPILVDARQPFLGIKCAITPGSNIEEIKKFSPDGSGFLCSFLFGGACVFNRISHDAVGDLDEGMRVGFEDIEFSLRLFRKGYKVGSSCVDMFVHDHPPAQRTADQEYEWHRYSRTILKEAANHFENKHGIKVWSEGVDEWLREREIAQGIVNQDTPTATTINIDHKPRIALVIDSPSWAFANIAQQIKNNLSDRFNFEIISTWTLSEIDRVQRLESGISGDQPKETHEALLRVLLRSDNFDLIHVFWRACLTIIEPARQHELAQYAKRIGITAEEFQDRFINNAKITTSVYDHLFIEDGISDLIKSVINNNVLGYSVSSKRLFNIYKNNPEFKPPASIISDGVDFDLFYPINLDRLRMKFDRPLVVGWVGNSAWGSENDVKGVHTILIPAIEQLKSDGVNICADFSDRQHAFVPHDRMVHYYAGIDVLVCVSSMEGTPNPVLEAMACGVPVISTDVGIVPEAFGEVQSQFILNNRTVKDLKSAIKKLVDNPDLLADMSRENLIRIKNFDWKIQTEKFAEFFSRYMRDIHEKNSIKKIVGGIARR